MMYLLLYNLYDCSFKKSSSSSSPSSSSSSPLREYNLKHSNLDTLNLICNYDFNIGTLNHFFLHCHNILTKYRILCIKLKASSSLFLRKPVIVLQQYVFMAIRAFQLNLIPTYSIHLFTTFCPQKGSNLLFLQKTGSLHSSS